MTVKLGMVNLYPGYSQKSTDHPHRSFVNAWQSSMRIHEVMAENRIRFSRRLNEMSEELASLAKEVDKNRKQASSII